MYMHRRARVQVLATALVLAHVLWVLPKALAASSQHNLANLRAGAIMSPATSPLKGGSPTTTTAPLGYREQERGDDAVLL